MAISYPLSVPSVKGPSSIRISARNVVGVSESPFTLQQQAVVHSGQRWEITVDLPPMKPDKAELWVTFLLSLKGRQGTFLMGDPLRTSTRGSATTTPGSPLSAGVDQLGESINIDGCPINTIGYLLQGDYVQFNTGSSTTLHKVLTDVNTDGSGQATLELWPDIRNALTDNSVMSVTNTVGLFRLTSNVAGWSINLPDIYGIHFEGVEVII